MKKLSILMFSLCALVAAGTASADKYDDALAMFKAADATDAYFSAAYGYALFPTIGKGGIGIGGAGGKGKVYVGGAHVGNSTMSEISWGLQLGGQAYSQIIFFHTEDAFKTFTTGKFKFGAGAEAVALSAGASAETNTMTGSAAGASGGAPNQTSTTAAGYQNGMRVFTMVKGGLMYQAVLEGASFKYSSL